MWFGESEANVREVFDKARAAAPCVRASSQFALYTSILSEWFVHNVTSDEFDTPKCKDS